VLPRPTLIVIGASTGGPEALALVLAELDTRIDVPIVVVQHMPDFFLARFAERLHARGPLPTQLAEHDTALKPGRVYVAPGNKHLEIRGGPGAYRANLRDGKRVHGCRPAVDVTLLSLARSGAGPTQVIILTGMGRDGADGAKALLAHEAHVIAQDKETSVVWGMPGAVTTEGSAHLTLALDAIPSALHARLFPDDGEPA
jgi:two-component system chemotaxis response regulator CheB